MGFYVYELVDPRKEKEYNPAGDPSKVSRVFYVGKGQGTRYQDHLQDAQRWNDNGRKGASKKNAKIMKILMNKMKFSVNIVFKTENEEEAFEKERELISFYGRDNLVNLTDGGEGNCGYRFTEEQRLKVSRGVKPRYLDNDYRKRHKEAIKSSRSSKKSRNKTRQVMLDRYKDPVDRYKDPEEIKKKMAVAVKEGKSSVEAKERASKASRRKYKGYSKEKKRQISVKMSKSMKKTLSSAEVRKRYSDAAKRRQAKRTPEERRQSALKAWETRCKKYEDGDQ